MIESPSATAIIDSKPPPPYTEEPSDKEPLIFETEPADVEVTLIEHKPITAKITTTMGHLQRIGGFRARWRGIRVSALYHLLHGVLTHLLAHTVFRRIGIFGAALSYILVSLGLCRVHMAWTHAMVAYPNSQPWFRRVPARKQCRPLLLPALVYAVAEQASLLLPLGVAFALGVVGPEAH